MSLEREGQNYRFNIPQFELEIELETQEGLESKKRHQQVRPTPGIIGIIGEDEKSGIVSLLRNRGHTVVFISQDDLSALGEIEVLAVNQDRVKEKGNFSEVISQFEGQGKPVVCYREDNKSAGGCKGLYRRIEDQISPEGKSQPIIFGNIAFGNIAFYPEFGKVLVNGKIVRLSEKLARLFREFMERPGQILTRRYLMKKVWETDWMGDTRTLDTNIHFLREALGDDKKELIRTVRGVGHHLGELRG